MNKIKHIVSLLALLVGMVAFSQQKTMHSVNSGAETKKVTFDGEEHQFNVIIGNGMYSPFKGLEDNSQPDSSEVKIGFYNEMEYFVNLFGSPLFASKGYFPDGILLKWDITSQEEEIKKLLIYRKEYGATEDSVLVASLPAEESSYKDDNIQYGQLYEYTVYAKGISKEIRKEYYNYVTGYGFALPAGRIAGQITFKGGNAVEDINVIAEPSGEIKNRSIAFDGTTEFYVPHRVKHDEMQLTNAFTIQMWTRASNNAYTLLEKGDIKVAYGAGKYTFDVAGQQVELAYAPPVDSFHHVAVNYDPATNYAKMYITSNGRIFLKDSVSITTAPVANTDNLTLGTGLVGNLDDIRLWGKALAFDEIEQNHSVYINPLNADLKGYWRLEIGIGNEFFDYSKKGVNYNENHGMMKNASWSFDVPSRTQLAYKAITDDKGAYIIEGLPFEASGSTYKVVPVYRQHEFDPSDKLRILDPANTTYNGVDFTDISSFEVTGTVRYFNTTFPVKDVLVYIDGKPATDSEGKLVQTNAVGDFKVEVPIGKHVLTVKKGGHTFYKKGRFPSNADKEFDFQEPLTGLVFVDSTIVKVSGRVVGGLIEANKILGFGKSKNNIGNATLTFTKKNDNGNLVLSDLDKENASVGFLQTVDANGNITGDVETVGTEDANGNFFLTKLSEEKDKQQRKVRFQSTGKYGRQTVMVQADEASGEYVAYLPPEEYTVNVFTSGYASNAFVINDISLNVKNTFEKNKVNVDTLTYRQEGKYSTLYPAYNDSLSRLKYEKVVQFDSTVTNVGTGLSYNREYMLGIDSFHYDHRQDFILRTKPEISIVPNGQNYWGDSTVVFSIPSTDSTQIVGLIKEFSTNPDDLSKYVFNHPVFSMGSTYSVKASLFEVYTNGTEQDIVPVSDGKVFIENGLAVREKAELALNHKGEVKYTFKVGKPNVAGNYLKFFNLVVTSGEGGIIKSPWSLEGGAYVFGAIPIGNNFVTSGPNHVMSILRDPPGSLSQAYLEKGSTFSFSASLSWGATTSISDDITSKVGSKQTLYAGSPGAGKIETVGAETSLSIGAETSTTISGEASFTTDLTTSDRWETSDDPEFVGTPGDLFIGAATNIVYGKAQVIGLLRDENKNFSVGEKIGLRATPEFKTGFMFTQFYIENKLLPKLIEVRNYILEYDTGYVSKIPKTDERYGSSNSDEKVWKELAKPFDDPNAPSYKVSPYLKSDTIMYFNNQISGWKYWLEKNEEEKINAEYIINKSLDGGAKFESSEESSYAVDATLSTELVISESLAEELDVEGGPADLNASSSISFEYSIGAEISTSGSETTTYGYVLQDGGGDDSFSIDVKKPKDGFGTVFSTRGGVSSCPYEGKDLTKYYKPGKVLHEATVQLQKPQIQIPVNKISDVPDNRPAEMKIVLSNATSEIADQYFTLIVDDASNRNGLVIKVDGDPIGNGRTFLVPNSTQPALVKTITVEKSGDVLEYKNIGLILKSDCQYDMSNGVANIGDTATFSVAFQPSCTEIELTTPANNWVLNTNAIEKDKMNIQISKYDVNVSTFNHIMFQYRGLGTSAWKTDKVFYAKQADFDEANEPKAMIDGEKINYSWDMSSLPDREYEIRAVAVCKLSDSEYIRTPSIVLQGIKDTKRPQLFGSPQPGDGILSANDEISVQFDEDIVASRLNRFNFSVTGILNGSPLRHSTSVALDGINDFVRIKNALPTEGSFTYEIWAKNEQSNKRSIIFSKGYRANDLIEMAFTKDDKLEVIVGNKTVKSIGLVPPTDKDWHHYAVTFNKSTNLLSVYRDGLVVIDNASVNAEYTGEGPIYLGRSAVAKKDYMKGAVHEFRMWNIPLQQTTVIADRFKQLSGTGIGMIGYWQLTEGYGKLANDRARGKTAEIYAEWLLLPQGYAAHFDGNDDYLQINTGATAVITPLMDYTIEMWFKATNNGKNQTLFSCGKGDGTDTPNLNKANERLSINLTADNKIKLFSNGQELTLEKAEDYIDNDWHHLAVTLKRKGNIIMYLDGEPKVTKSATPYGGFASSRMWIGARASIDGLQTVNFDQHFQGGIDEVRIWNMAKNEKQILQDKHAALRGEEMGLVAYYPFEHYITDTGVQVASSTLNDKWENPFGENGGTAQNVGGVELNKQTPKVAKARPVSKVDFSWAVNGDKIIITPSAAQASLIENVTLDVTVYGVEDYRENVLASPITWTVYVDRNPMTWEKPMLEYVKNIGDSLTITTKIINKGGTEQAFNLAGLPLWLKASPSKGSLAPLAEQKIDLIVSPDLNIGKYAENIRLTTDFGFDEVMLLDLKVKKDIPEHWKINKSDYSYTMNIIGKLNIDEVFSTDEEDVLAVFVGDEMRGMANVKYLEEIDDYQVYLTVYSNARDKNERLEFRIWDASEGLVRGNVSPSYNFEGDKIHGTTANPITFSVENVLVKTLNFQKGWQWVSFGLSGDELSSSANLFKGMSASEGDLVKTLEGFDQFGETSGWVGKISEKGGFKPTVLYKVYMDKPATLIYSGNIVNPLKTSIEVTKGWNWIGYVPLRNIEINEALAGYPAQTGDVIKSQFEFAIYDENVGWVGSLAVLKPDKGYMLKTTKKSSFNYPEKGIVNGRKLDVEETNFTFDNLEFNPYAFESNINMIVSFDNPNIEIGAFINDELRGVAKYIGEFNEKNVYFISVFGEKSNEKITLNGIEASGGKITFENSMIFESGTLKGMLNNPIILKVRTKEQSEIFENDLSVFPNPFNEHLKVRIENSEKVKEVSLYDVQGKYVADFEKISEQIWATKVKKASSGLYLVKIIYANDEIKTIKVIKR